MVMAEIKLTDVSFSYSSLSRRPALDKVNLTIKAGSFVGIVGHTGSGKSTLVSLIDGLLSPTSGAVTVNGVTVRPGAKKKELARLRQHVGYVFQFPEQQLFAETVGEDIAFGPTNLGWQPTEIKQAVKTALQMVGLPQELAGRSPFALSGGQMRRVAIAGVLAMAPSVLILDEPTAGLDGESTARLLENIAQLNQQGTTILLITHQMDQVATYADQVVVMNQGHLVKAATPAAIFNDQAFLAANHLAMPAAVKIAHQLGQAGVELATPLTMSQLADRLAGRLKEGKDER